MGSDKNSGSCISSIFHSIRKRLKRSKDDRKMKMTKERIFNARTRIIGVDRAALECQVTERNNAEAVEAARDSAYSRDMIRNDKLGVLLQERQDKDARNLHKKLNEFRSQYQTPDSRREWDLNNPEFLKIQKPTRESDCDKNLEFRLLKFLKERICPVRS